MDVLPVKDPHINVSGLGVSVSLRGGGRLTVGGVVELLEEVELPEEVVLEEVVLEEVEDRDIIVSGCGEEFYYLRGEVFIPGAQKLPITEIFLTGKVVVQRSLGMIN